MSQGEMTPVSAQRTLLRELRSAREAAKFTQKDVAEALEWSLSKVIRIETGVVGISVTDLKALLLHYGIIDNAAVERLVQLARLSKMPSWWDEYRADITPGHWTFLGLEQSAVRIRQFLTLAFPALLQTQKYAEVLTAIGTEPEAAKRCLELRMRRQEILKDTERKFTFIIDESVLHRSFGSAAVMCEQLKRVKELSDRPNITVQLMPFSAGLHEGLNGSFSICDFSTASGDYGLLFPGTSKDIVFTSSSEETAEYPIIFSKLEKLALSPQETIRVIDEHLARMSA